MIECLFSLCFLSFVAAARPATVHNLPLFDGDPLFITSDNFPDNCCHNATFQVFQAENKTKYVRVSFTDIDVPPRSVFAVSSLLFLVCNEVTHNSFYSCFDIVVHVYVIIFNLQTRLVQTILVISFVQFSDPNSGKTLAAPMTADDNGVYVHKVYTFKEAVVKLTFTVSAPHNSSHYTGFRAVFSLTDGMLVQTLRVYKC